MQTNKVYYYLSAIALTAAMIGCSTQAADNANQSSNTVNKLPVDVKIVKSLPLIQNETIAGSILPNREVIITSEVSKKVVGIHFTEGSFVNKGQLLYKLDDSDIKAKLKQLQAELALAKLSESRLSLLLKNESVRQEEYDVAFTKLQSLQASEELLQVDLSKTSIHAPFSGVIGITKAEVGSLVSPGIPLATLQEHNNVKVQFSVNERYLEYVKRGKKISFSVTNSTQEFSAKIAATESGIDTQSRTITVQAITPNDQGVLRPGMSARVNISTVSDDAIGISLPTESLMPGSNGYSVFIVKNGVAKLTPVSIGNRNESEALITSGLNDGDTVMISNILRSGDGTPVQIVSVK